MNILMDKTFTGEHFCIDGTIFVNCRLTSCTLEYSGEPVGFYGSCLTDCRYIFLGKAKRTVLFLQESGMMPFRAEEWGEMEGSEERRNDPSETDA